MPENDPNKSIRDNVLKSIDEGKVKQHSRSYFALRGVAITLGIILIALIALFLVSFAVFTLRQRGGLFAPAFGARGWREFIFDLPWLIIISAIALLLLLEVLVQRYKYAYRRPLVISLVGLAVFVGIGSVIVERLHVHDRLWLATRRHGLPLARPFYDEYGPGGCREVTAGTILQKTDYGFELANGDDEIHVVVTPQTRLGDDLEIEQGNTVAVLGQCAIATTTAIDIRAIPKNFRPEDNMMMRQRIMPAPNSGMMP